MSEQERILAAFVEAFAPRKEQRIILYGLGINTQYLVQHLREWNITGLMDPQNEGKTFWGLPVLRVDEASERADLIVIIARPSVLQIIYSRIRHLEPTVPVFQYQGIPMAELAQPGTENEAISPYWESSYADFEQAVEAHDTVSFDLFDTLIMRTLPRPWDVFDLMEDDISGGELLWKPCFRECRLKAERMALEQSQAPGIDEIYRQLQMITGVSQEEAIRLQQLEWEMEKRVLCVREEMRRLFRYALSRGKQVLILSDMYWGAQTLAPLLDQLGLSGYTALLVSSDCGMTKEDGGLYAEAKKRFGGRILHIGDNQKADIQQARAHGITAMQVLSAYELCLSAPISKVLVPVNSREDNLYMGAFLSWALNSPWALHRFRGRLNLSTPELCADVAFAPMVHSFMRWMVRTLRGQRREEAVVLFTARDGYLPRMLYEQVTRENPEEYPEGIYFLTSRRSVTVANLKEPSDMDALVREMAPKGSYGEIIRQLFGIDAREGDPWAKRRAVIPKDWEELCRWLHRYDEAILHNAAEERARYLEYISSLNLGTRTVYLFDLAVTGTVPVGIERLLGRRCSLICFSTWGIPNAYYQDLTWVRSYLGNFDHYDATWFFLRVYKLFEILFAPDEGSFCAFGPDGALFREERLPREHAACIRRMQERLLSTYSERFCSARVADAFLSLLDPKHSVTDRTIRAAFCMEDSTRGEPMHRLWEELFGKVEE